MTKNPTCETKVEPIEAYPGEQFKISMITVGQMYGSSAGIIDATLEDEQAENHVLVDTNHHEMSSQCTRKTFALHSNRDSALIKLKPVTSELSTNYNITLVEFN